MANLKIEARPALHIPFVKYDLWLVDYRGAPFVPLQPVCDVLGLNCRKQVNRLLHAKSPYRIKSVVATEDGKLTHLEAIPLENLSAFLFTLKPNIPNLIMLRNVQRSAARQLTFFWSKYQREYCMPQTIAADLASLARLMQIKQSPQPTPKDKITPAMILQIKEIKNTGISITQVAKQTGYSRTTISLILSGKYKTKAGEMESHS